MTYPHVTQFETRALEAEALARLGRERRAARAPQRTTGGTRRIATWLPLPRADRSALTHLKLTDGER
jgi:hypothetical protein